MALTREQLQAAWERTLAAARQVAQSAAINIDYQPVAADLLEQAWNGGTDDARQAAQKAIDTHREAYMAGLRDFARLLHEAFENMEPLPPLNLTQRHAPNAPPKPPMPARRLEPGEEGPDPLLEYRRENNAWLEQWYYPHEASKVIWLLLKEAWETRKLLEAEQEAYQ